MIVDDGKEFYRDTTKLMEKHDVIIQRGDPSQHRSQGIVERFNRTLADRLFTYQYHKELKDPSKSSREWVSRLQNVVSSLNKVRYLYQAGELEGYQYKGERRKRSTNPIWSVDVHKTKDRYIQKHQPMLYYLDDGPKRYFIFEELQPIHDP